MGRFRRGTLVVALLVPFVLGAVLATALGSTSGGPRDLVVPDAWRTAWETAHVRQGEHVALAWGERAGTDPRVADADLAFDPGAVLARLERLHAVHVNDLGLGARDGPLAERKLLVVVAGTWPDGTWPDGSGPDGTGAGDAGRGDVGPGAGAGEGTIADVVDGVGVLRVTPAVLAAADDASADEVSPPPPEGPPAGSVGAPDGRAVAAAPGTSWELARGFAELALRVTAAAGGGGGPVEPPTTAFRSASAAYLATLTVPGAHADVSELVRAPHLAWGSARHGAAGWLLLDSLVARADPGLVADLWAGVRDGETVLGAYARLTSADPGVLNRRVAQYAMRAAAGDAAGRAGVGLLDDVDPVLVADRTTPTEPVPGDPAHHRVTGAFAPGAYGFTVVRLVPDGSGGDVRVRVRGHAEAFAPGAAGWSVGMVAVGAEGVRYGPVTETVDGEVTLTPRAGDEAVLLVVTATPGAALAGAGHTGTAAADAATTRYPYEFRVEGATVADPTAAPAPPGGHRHANGGGWVDDRASVDATVFVGPHAVVRGAAQVHGEARLEGRAWVDEGAVVEGRAVVRDAAVVRGGARLSGSVVVGGDVVVSRACAAGEHTAYRPDGTCDGTAADATPPVTPFTAQDLALTPAPADAAATAPPDPATAAPAPGGGTSPGTPSSTPPAAGGRRRRAPPPP
ncbi:DUF6055 domain-containing protein, partial [Cellulomonas sp. 179-A 9B4 NHS]|uniref:DUF6055 domain-containing protein n=1 Tax=Cellulomonas sp. 179-A 9B4 NHS TaxID=3142379 RepID=UPI0039A0185C